MREIPADCYGCVDPAHPHRGVCYRTPIWEQTVKAVHADPDEPLEMRRAYSALKFLPIYINRSRG